VPGPPPPQPHRPAPEPEEGPTGSNGPSLEVGGGARTRVALTLGGVLLALVLAAVAAYLLTGRDDGDADHAGGDDTSSTTPQAPASDPSLDLPTIDPSDFPSDLATPSLPSLPPTELPTARPPKAPSGLPSGIPSDLPPFPTDPADLESWFTDYLEQVSPGR